MREEGCKHSRNPEAIEVTLMAADTTLDAVKAAQDLGAQRVVLRVPAFAPEPLRQGMETIANEIIAKI